jgi:hypothetical protein
MLNPGGPGGQGLSQPTDLIDLGLPNDVTNAYDLIGMDPRGVGHSTPVSCGFTVEQGHRGNVPPYATDEADVAGRGSPSRRWSSLLSSLRWHCRHACEEPGWNTSKIVLNGPTLVARYLADPRATAARWITRARNQVLINIDAPNRPIRE